MDVRDWYALALIVAGVMSYLTASFGVRLFQRDRSKLQRGDVLGLQALGALAWTVLLYAYGIDFDIVPIVQWHFWALLVGVFVAQQVIDTLRRSK